MKHTIFYEPVTSLEEAENLLTYLHKNDLAFHPEDRPHGIVRIGDGSRLFDQEEADALEQRMDEIYAQEWPLGHDPCSFLLDLERQQTPETTLIPPMEERLIESMARTIWVEAWATWNNEQEKPTPTSQRDLMDVAPETPPRAYKEAALLLGRYAQLNRGGQHGILIVHRAANAEDLDWERVCGGMHEGWLSRLGHCLVMMSIGAGVSWFDDHEWFPLECPRAEYNKEDLDP